MFGESLRTAELAFDSLWARGQGDMPVRRGLLPGGQSGKGRYFFFDGCNYSPSIVFPDMPESPTAALLLVAARTGLMLRLEAKWNSSYGSHGSVAEYSVTKPFGKVEITGIWQQTLPSLITRSVDRMTAGVREYHADFLRRIRAPDKPIGGMLVERYSSAAPVVIPASELIPIAEAINDLVPKF